MLALDLETYPIAPGMLIPKPVCYSHSDGTGTNWVVRPIADMNPEVLTCQIVGANIAYDMAVLYQHCDVDVWQLYENRQVTDVQIRQQLIDIAQGIGTKRKYSLQALAKRLLGVDVDKENTPRLTYHKVAGLPVSQWPSEYVDYARKDAEITYQIWETQEKLQHPNVKRWEHYEAYAAFCLHLMAAWGIRADPKWWAALKGDVDVKWAKLQQQMRDLGVMREDGSKDKKAMQALVEKAYNYNPPRTDKGAVKTDRLTLEESGDPTLEALTGEGPIEKIVTTYGKVVEAAVQAPYNSRYNILVSSGRTSSNFQQWPRGGPNAPDEVNRLRACFQARPGYVFCSVDFTGAELVSLAQVCFSVLGYSHLRDALNAGQNLHTRLAARFVGCTYEQAQARLKAKDPILVSARQAAKPVNFSVPGLAGPDVIVVAAHKEFVFFCELAGLRKECGGSRCRECRSLVVDYIRLYKEEWAEVPDYHRWIFNNLSDPWSTPITGFLRGGLYASDAANHPFQHLTSRMSKSALIALSRQCYKSSGVLAGTRPWGFQHDEILAEIPEAVAPQAADEMCRIMLEAAQKWTPDVKVTSEPALSRRWWKGAECLRNDKGVLQIWEPK
jgi:DNA polymerase-1